MDSALERLIGPEEISERWGISIRTVYSWRATQKGPPAARIGKHLRYRLKDVEAWLDEQITAGSAAS